MITRGGTTLTSGTDYNTSTDVLYGNEYEIASAPWRVLSTYTDRSFFKEDGKYVVTVTVTISSNPNAANLVYTSTIYALPACACRFKTMDALPELFTD